MSGIIKKSESGFTIVELLIVIVVVAVLATIAIVSYRGIQERANDTAIKNDMNAFAKKISLFQAEYGHYPMTLVELESLDFKPSHKSYATSVDFNNLAYCAYRPNHSDYQIVIGAVSASGVPYYNYSGEGFQPQIYTGLVNASSSLSVICREIMGVTPEYDITGHNYASGIWSKWAGG